MRVTVLAGLTAVLLMLAACAKSAGPPASVTRSGGDAQVAAPGAAVAIPPAVVVADRFGNPVADVTVDFAVTSGGGVAWCASARTDATGRASCAIWTLGAARGTNTLSATVSGLPPAVFTAAVQADVFLELGHSASVSQLRLQGTRLLSQDGARHWVLWDVTTCTPIASGDVPCPPVPETECTPATADLAGPTLLVTFQSGTEVRDASDGRILSRRVGTPSWTRLASDGSFVYAGTTADLSAWSPDGRLLFSRAGDYSGAKTFADGAALRVAVGPAGANVVETIDPSTGTSSVSAAFNGAFHSWFTDGQRFVTHLSNTAWVYSSAGASEAILSLPTIENLTGQGTWLWTHATSTPTQWLTVYRVDGGGTPAASYMFVDANNAKALPGEAAIGVVYFGPSAAIIDLSGATPSRTDHPLPIASLSTVAASSSAQWFVANQHGAILDGASLAGSPRYCGLGAAMSLTGGGPRVSVATASGRIQYFDVATSALEGEIGFPSTQVQLSSDGLVLAAAEYVSGHTLKTFALPAGTEVRSWSYAAGGLPTLYDFSLSASGTQLGQVLQTSSSTDARSFCDRQVLPIAGGAPTWTAANSSCEGSPILLSPAGNRVAFSSDSGLGAPVTDIYQDGTLVSALAGRGVGWLDDGRLLVNIYQPDPRPYIGYQCASAAIHDTSGALLAGDPPPCLPRIQVVTPTSVYSPDQNAIFSLDTGAALWTGPAGSKAGAVAGGRVVYRFGAYLLSEPY